MKKTLILILLSFIAFESSSQLTKKNPTPQSAEWFLQKSKKQKTAAWLLLSGGSLAVVSGYTFFVYEGLRGDGVKSVKAKIAIGVFYLGGVAVISSIPLFIAAARNKGIALSGEVNLKFESLNKDASQVFATHSFPAISFKLRF